MEARILRVAKCGECFTVKSEKTEGGVLNKRVLVLQELQYSEGDIVIATLKFQAREYNGQMFMDVVATEIVKR